MARQSAFKFKSGPRRAGSSKSSGSSNAPRRFAPNPIQARKGSLKSERPMKAIFRGMIMSVAGNIMTTSKNPTPIAYESIAKWITLHGGICEREVSESTTHLICSIEEYKKGGPQVQKAWQLGKTQCHIVVFDWLEDCLLGKKLKKSLRSEKGYTLDRTLARIKKGKTDHAEYRKKFEEGVRDSKELCDNRLNHILSEDGFEYKVTLTRVNLGGRVMTEKYTCYLFESNAKPSHYMTGAKLSRTHRPISYYRNFCHPMPFDQAFHHFKYFFHDKTGIEWDQRLEGIKMPDHCFVYTPPALGRPVGAVPKGYVRPELREVDKEGGEEGSGKEDGEGDVVYDTDSEVDDSVPEEDSNTIPTGSTCSRAPSSEFNSFHSVGSGGEGSGSQGSGSGSRSVENDGLGGASDLVLREQIPPTVIYISD